MRTLKSNKIFLILAIADLGWSISAWIFDWPKILSIPVYLLPLILICPIYPLLLSITWFSIYKENKLNLLVFYLGILGSVVYGVGAVIYYPNYMMINGFDWYAFGGIFWVLFYAIQAVYLLAKWKHAYNIYSLIIATLFMGAKLILDYFSRTYGYIVDDNFPLVRLSILIAVMTLTLIIAVAKLKSKAT